MKAAVRYYSRTGHTKALAQAIAKGAGVTAESVPAEMTEKVNVLFIGSGLYAAFLDKHLKDYLESLDASKVGKVVMFSTSMLSKRAFPLMKKVLEAKGITVADETCYAKSMPNADLLKEAELFGKKLSSN